MKKCVLFKGMACFVLTFPSIGSGNSVFIGYEFGEMAFNDFKNFAGEVGYTFDNKQSLRLSYMNVALSERHLSSSESAAVDGENIEGLWRGVDIYYDYPISQRIDISPSIGYHDTEYSHTVLEETVKNRTATAGVAISYLGDDVLGIDELYWRFSVTLNYRLNPLERTLLGDSVVNGGSFDFYPQIFIGYAFE